MPDLNTKMMPASAARSGTRGRPPRVCGGLGGKSGATSAQSASETRRVGTARLYDNHAPGAANETASDPRWTVTG